MPSPLFTYNTGEVHHALSLYSLIKAMPNDLGHRSVDHWPVCPLDASSCCLKPGAQKNHHQPVGDVFQSWLALSICHIHMCIAALQGT